MIKPAIRYHGAKWVLAPWILGHFPAHTVFVEPFGGSAAVLLRKDRCYAEAYNDLCGAVVNLFEGLRDPEMALALAKAVENTPFSRDEFFAAYGRCSANDKIERARRLVVLSFMGFGSDSAAKVSGFRANSNRSGSTPAHDFMRWPARVAALTARLRGVVIENRDYADVMLAHDRVGTLHFVDPPYVLATRGRGGSYKHDFRDEDHRRLIEVLESLSGMVILCGYPSDLYREILPGWRFVERQAMADGAKRRTEVLWFNKAAWAARPVRELDLLGEKKHHVTAN